MRLHILCCLFPGFLLLLFFLGAVVRECSGFEVVMASINVPYRKGSYEKTRDIFEATVASNKLDIISKV